LRTSDLVLTVGTVVILIALPITVVLAMTEARRIRKDRGAGSVAYRPFVFLGLAFIGSIGVLTVVGWGADRSGWYSPAAVGLPHQGPVHLLTLWVRGIVAIITPAWIHPSLFARMPTGELVAAFLAPVAALAAAVAMFRLIVRLPLRAPGRAHVLLATGAFGMMLLSVVASVRWLLAHPGQQGATALQARNDQLAPGHTGWVVVFLLAVLAVTALVGMRRVLGNHPDQSTQSDAPAGENISHATTGDSVTSGTFPVLFGTQ
jgi:hypothetical protein